MSISSREYTSSPLYLEGSKTSERMDVSIFESRTNRFCFCGLAFAFFFVGLSEVALSLVGDGVIVEAASGLSRGVGAIASMLSADTSGGSICMGTGSFRLNCICVTVAMDGRRFA